MKEYLYVGHYYDIYDNYVLKNGTTNNLERRRKEHTRNYRNNKTHPLAKDAEFVYDWYIPLSKYNTLRYEDKTREEWKKQGFGTYIRNDRFVCKTKPEKVIVTIRKTYEIVL